MFVMGPICNRDDVAIYRQALLVTFLKNKSTATEIFSLKCSSNPASPHPMPFYTAKEAEKESSQETDMWGKEMSGINSKPSCSGDGSFPQAPSHPSMGQHLCCAPASASAELAVLNSDFNLSKIDLERSSLAWSGGAESLSMYFI